MDRRARQIADAFRDRIVEARGAIGSLPPVTGELEADELKREAARLRKRYQSAIARLRELARKRGIPDR